MAQQNEPASSFSGAVFATTNWSVLLRAGQSDQALERICTDYWKPLYSFLRRQGCDPEKAKDLTQAFFASLLERKDFAFVDRERGKFRTFLIVSLKHFMANTLATERAHKRGGGRTHVSLELMMSDEFPGVEPSDGLTPDQVYDRQWALSLLETVLKRLEVEFEAAGKHGLFKRLCHLLTGDKGEGTYSRAAQELGLTESAIKVTVYRMRQRYRELLRAEVARTVSAPDQVEEELAQLIAILRR